MNWAQVEGKWQQFSGKMRSKWAKLTNDDWSLVGSKKDQLLGKLQERYGYKKDQAEKEVDDFINGL
ncbi:MAG TPA: CsbD family protein [Gemmataceae bacterium]|nr:CsbD family protein [Gemmataceae bacterium]